MNDAGSEFDLAGHFQWQHLVSVLGYMAGENYFICTQ